MNDFSTPGRYRCHILESALNKQQDSECVQFAAKVHAYEYFDEATKQWQNCTEHDLGGFVNTVIIKKDGGINEFGCERCEKALGWTGGDLTFLSQSFEGHPIQVIVKTKPYNGQMQTRADMMDHVDAEGGALKSVDATAINELNAKFGAKLRAIAKPAAAPAAGAAKMAAPAKKGPY